MHLKPEEINYRLFTRTALGLKRTKPNVTVRRELMSEDISDNLLLLDQAAEYWNKLADFRKRARRASKYNRGDQWSDIVFDPDEKDYVSESEYIKRQGRVPLKQNIIRQMTRNLVGQFRSTETKAYVVPRKQSDKAMADMVSAAIDYVQHINQMEEIDARAYETFLLSGMAVHKNAFSFIKERDMEDVTGKYVNIHRAFFNPDITDPRCTELRMCGEIIDSTIDEVCAAFARNKSEEERIREIYRGDSGTGHVSPKQGLTAQDVDSLSFLSTNQIGKCRLYEVWYLKNVWRMYVHDEASGKTYMTEATVNELQHENAMRIQQAAAFGVPEDEVPMLAYEDKLERAWFVKFLTPTGHCLYEAETHYAHQEHPYTYLLYPLIDGEVWGFVEDIIDQQRYINRTIILLDFIVSASAKGLLLVHEDSIPEGMTINDFSSEWVKFNGAILVKGKPGTPMPQQISANSVNVGISEMIQLQMMLVKDISGVHDALQGKAAASGKAASLYAQEAQNASLNSLDYQKSFMNFKERRDRKIMKLILQYYDKPRNIAISGSSNNYTYYDPDKVRTGEYDLVVAHSPSTPTYKAMLEETLMALLDKQLIDIKMYLQHTSLPFAEKLLDDINGREEALKEGKIAPPNEELMKQVQGDPNAAKMIQQMVRGAA